MSKRLKVSFESVNKGKYAIIPKASIAETNKRIKEEMRIFMKSKKSKQ